MGTLAIAGGRRLRDAPFFGWPVFDERDRERLLAVLESGKWADDGPREAEFEQAFARRQGALGAVGVTNGTETLLLCLRALGIKPGDEVIVPALTWIATATAVIEANAVPVFADVDPATFCLDPKAVAARISPRTVAMIPVHLYTCMADMDGLGQLASKHGLALIEDCAHAHGARWRDRGAGAGGDLGSWSFQMSKVMTAGEGGMITGNDRQLLDRVYSLKNCGRMREGSDVGMLGGNHRMTEWQAAVLLGQLSRLDEQLARREQALVELRRLIRDVPGVEIIADQPQVTQRPFYRLGFHYRREDAGGIPLSNFVDAVRAEGVPIERTYPVVYQNVLYRTGDVSWYAGKLEVDRCEVAESVALEGAFMLPHEILLGSDADLEDVAGAMKKVIDNPREAAGAVDRLKDRAKRLLGGVHS